MKIAKFKDKISHRSKWKADFTCAGVRHRVLADSTAELYDEIDAIRRRARQERYGLAVEHKIVTLSQLVEERKRDYNLQNRRHRAICKVLDRFQEHLGKARAVHTLKTADLRLFVQALRFDNPSLSAATINNYLNRVNAMLHKAAVYFPALESWKPPRMPFEQESGGRQRLITEEEIARLFFELRAPPGMTGGEQHRRRETTREVRTRQMVADIFELSLMTGMRKTEARTLTRTKIDWTLRQFGDLTVYGYLQLAPASTKTKEPRRIPLNFDARQILE